MRLIVIFVCYFVIFSNLFGQNKGVTFKKSQNKYKLVNYIYEDIKGEQQVMNFEINFQKKDVCSDERVIHKLYFGSRNYFNFISFSEDTICYYLTSDDNQDCCNSLSRKPIFILDEEFKDTLFIPEFGMMYNHFITLEKKCFYSTINDTIYVFKLWYKRNNNYSSSSEDNYFYFKEIAISKKYGFVLIQYKYHNAEIELRYY